MDYCYEYPRPMVTADCVVFNYHKNQLRVLLIQRKDQPFKDHWAFPGGFIEMEEELEDSASRELMEETGLKWSNFEQLGAFGKLGRDPRGRTITVAFVGFVEEHSEVQAGSDAAHVKWYNIYDLPPMAFDHNEIFKKAIYYLQNRISSFNGEELPFGIQEKHFEIMRLIKTV